jgi:hypothetical protein
VIDLARIRRVRRADAWREIETLAVEIELLENDLAVAVAEATRARAAAGLNRQVSQPSAATMCDLCGNNVAVYLDGFQTRVAAHRACPGTDCPGSDRLLAEVIEMAGLDGPL